MNSRGTPSLSVPRSSAARHRSAPLHAESRSASVSSPINPRSSSDLNSLDEFCRPTSCASRQFASVRSPERSMNPRNAALS